MDLSLTFSFSLSVIVLQLGEHFSNGFNLETRLPVIKYGSNGSYFGYSVAEHQSVSEVTDQVEHSWLLVGAPLGQNLQPGTNRSGALWKCPLTTRTDDCQQVVTDGKRNAENGLYDPSIEANTLMPPLDDEIKNGQWLGVTVRSQGAGGKVMVCAHRYIRRGVDYQWGRGLCYTLTQRLDYDESWEPCKGRPTNRAHEQYGYCQAGTSGLLLDDDTAVIGTPGPYTWRGTVFVLSISDNFLDRDKTLYYAPLTEEEAPVDKYSYLGMSVTAGYLLGPARMIYAAGAPRSNGTGQVVLFSKLRPTVTTMDVRLVLSGEQFASSFGYEVATADVNGDKLPDLLVAAPFYFSKEAGGAVYIYINTKTASRANCLDCRPPVRFTGKPESRFGFAMTSLGDLNKDGYDDVAIGAPYEGAGTVYIFLGSKDGLIAEPSQIIRAETFGLSGMGHALSGGLDLDRNGYPDVLVGAYESDAVVLLRARPIVGLTTRVGPDANLRNIDPARPGCTGDPGSEHTCFTFEACVSVEAVVKGSAAGADAITLRYRLEADHKRKFSRVWFGPDHTVRPSSIEAEILLQLEPLTGELKHCHTHTAYIKENTRDIQSAVVMQLSYWLVQKEPVVPVPGAPVPSVDALPILNQQEAAKHFTATFQKDCGANDVCESQLFLEATLGLPTTGANNASWELLLGQHQELSVNVTAHNLRESAYEAQLFVQHSPSLSYIGKHSQGNKQVTCQPHNKTVVACSLGNPLKQGASATVQLRFDPKGLEDAESRLEFTVSANSTSREVEPQGPLALRATVVKRAELSIKGLARPEQVLYGGQIRGESAMIYRDEIGSRILHTYQVFNQGPWRVSNLEVHIIWPFQVANNKPQGKWLLYMEDKPHVEALGGGECYMAPGQVNPLGLLARPGLLETPLDTPPQPVSPLPHNVTTSAESGGGEPRLRRDTEMVVRYETVADGQGGRRQRVVNMNCQLGTAKCFKFRCVVFNLQKNQEATIFIRARLWNATLVEDYADVDLVRIASHAKIHIPPSLIIHQDISDDVAQVETLAKVDSLEQVIAEPVPLWVFVLAALLGLLLFVLLTLLLYKLGFFKRRRPDPTLSGNLEKHRVDEYHD